MACKCFNVLLLIELLVRYKDNMCLALWMEYSLKYLASRVASKAQRCLELLVKYADKRLVRGLMLGYTAQRCLALLAK